jgi:hypothetical protein
MSELLIPEKFTIEKTCAASGRFAEIRPTPGARRLKSRRLTRKLRY